MSRFRPCARTTERGFSLLELFVVLSLSGLFIGAVQETLITALRTVDSARRREDIRLQLARALDRLTREASYASEIDTMSSTRFQFDADIDRDGTLENVSSGADPDETDIEYRDLAGDFVRRDSKGDLPLVSDLTSVTYEYLDASGNATSTAADVRIVQIAIGATSGSETISLAGAVYLRNND
jgi:type II secretory pathway pseudopilin PulG